MINSKPGFYFDESINELVIFYPDNTIEILWDYDPIKWVREFDSGDEPFINEDCVFLGDL